MEKKFSQLLETISGRLGQYLFGLFILLSSLVFTVFFVWEVSANPFEQARVEAQQIAQQYAGLTQVDEFAIYNGSETYYSMRGTDQSGQEVWALVPASSETIYVYPVEAGISKEKAEVVAKDNGAEAIERLTLGYRDGKPIWEVKSGTAYYLIEFESGTFIKKEGL